VALLIQRRQDRPRASARAAVLLFTALLGPGCVHAGQVRSGDRLPDLTLRDWHGAAFDLTSLRGKVVLVDFWASWCEPCRTALPALDAMAQRHHDAGLTVVGIDIDGSRESADRFLAERLPHPTLVLLYDRDGAMMAKLGASGMPALYLVDRTGVVRRVDAGYTPEHLHEVERSVTELLGATPPP
jgi:thiol-disulfide isomerase/thioredoxin